MRPTSKTFAAIVFMLVVLLGLPTFARAEEATDVLGLMPSVAKLYGASGQAYEEIGSVFPSVLAVDTTPSSISTGIACSMDEFCGIDPCTCGKPDAWGACACAGFADTAPTVTISSTDASVVDVVEFAGRRWLVPKGAGEADVTIRASLVHYADAATTIHVRVLPFGFFDVLFLLAALAIVAGAVYGAWRLVRLVARLASRAAEKRREAAAVKAGLKASNPLTWKELYRGRIHPGARTRRRVPPALHDFGRTLAEAAPVVVAGLVVFVALVPVSTTCVADISVANIDYTHEQIKFQLFAPDLAPAVSLATTVFGACLALWLFRFLLDKRATTAYFSVGLSRTTLYLVRLAAGAIGVLVAIGIPFAASFAANAVSLGVYDGFVHEALYVAAGYMTVALVAFALASCAIACAGSLFEAVLFATCLLAGVSVVLWGVGELARYLLVGDAAGVAFYGQDAVVAPSFIDSFTAVNPALFFMQEGADHQFFMALHPVYYPETGSFSYVGAWLAAALVLAASGLALFCRRPGEQAEMAGMNPALSIVSVAVVGLAVFAATVALLAPVDVVVALVAAALLFALASCIFLFGPLRGRTPRRVSVACVAGELCAMGVVVAVLATGGFGYAGWIPDAGQVVSVEVSYTGSPSYLTSSFSGTSGTGTYYCTSTRTYTSADAIDTVRAVHASLAQTARASLETNYMDVASTPVIYDVEIAYTLADGSTATRYYSRARIEDLETLALLDDAPESAALEAAVVTQDVTGLSDDATAALSQSPSYAAFSAGSVYLADGALNRILSADLSDAEKTALKQAIASDLAALPAAERYAPSSAAQVVVMFTRSPELDVSSFGYSFSNAVVYVDAGWTNTLAWLSREGWLDKLDTSLDPAIFESLTFQLDDPYASINKVTSPVSRYFMGYRTDTAGAFWVTQDYGALKTVTDSACIAAVLPSLRLGCFMDGGYLVQGKLRGIDAYVYFYLPRDLAPAFVTGGSS